MIDKMQRTLEDLRGIDFILTRFDPKTKIPDDLDILVNPQDFERCVQLLKNRGYLTSSHDCTFGGRIVGMQVNLTKFGKIKIDLHQDFTWRRKRYIDLNILWKKSQKHMVDPTWDAFLVMINIIFEKTYFKLGELNLLLSKWQKIVGSSEFKHQTSQYGWKNTFLTFKNWIEKLPPTKKFPLFLPVGLVLFSYLEKFDFMSLVYYLFFRVRYIINKKLPYDRM